MRTHFINPIVITIVLLALLVQGCAQSPSYAPVVNTGQTLANTDGTGGAAKPEADVLTAEPMPTTPEQSTQSEHYDQSDRTLSEITLFPQYRAKSKSNRYHIVQKGETLYSIGQHSGYGFHNLAQWNHLPAPYAVNVGRKIKLFDKATEHVYRNTHKKRTINAIKTRKKSKKPFISTSNYAPDPIAIKSQKKSHTLTLPTSYVDKEASISIDKQKMLKLAFEWPIKGAVVKNFRQCRDKGIEISGKFGQSVHAAEAGKVVYGSRWLVGFGSLLVIKHDPLYLSAYANNSELLVKEGQRVRKGQVIAKVGNAPYRKAALHFEIRKNGKSINPLRFLPNS
jgi:lipoprotein NlpD